MEWRLFDEHTVPEFTTQQFFSSHPWISPVDQRGHEARLVMVRDFIWDLIQTYPDIGSIVDLGCGDGTLLKKIKEYPVRSWGYDLGEGSLWVATTQNGVDARKADILTDQLEYGDLIVATEVVEHLLNPHQFIADLPGRFLLLSSPYDENDEHNYYHHAWAWDTDGYRKLISDAGWEPIEQRGCPEGFQAVFATR